MLEIIYDPSIINSFISIIYCATGDLNPNSSIMKMMDMDHHFYSHTQNIPLIDGKNKNDLFHLIYDSNENIWIFFHMKKDWDDVNIVHKYLNTLISSGFCKKKIKYFGIIENNVKLEFISAVSQNKCIYDLNTKYSKFINFSDENFEKKINYQDIIIPTINGFTHINSGSEIDLIFSTIRISKNLDHCRKLIDILISEHYDDNLGPVVNKLITKFQILQISNPKNAYSHIFQLISQYDEKYFCTKMRKFQQDVVEIFQKIRGHQTDSTATASIITDFINIFKIDLAYELNTIYQRLRFYPNERIKLYESYPQHPYIKLLKIIHNNYLHTKNRITTDEIYILLSQSNNFITNDELTLTIKNAIGKRSELFIFMYNLYIESREKCIKPKYRTKHNYFPFKIFSSTLFFMEHMLASPESN
jgi:hypothetical protein